MKTQYWSKSDHWVEDNHKAKRIKHLEKLMDDLNYREWMSEEDPWYLILDELCYCDCDSCIRPYVRTESGLLIKEETL